MVGVRDSFADLERYRQQLEDNIAKLRNSLQHWRQWDAEYELLKEQIEALPAPVTQKDVTRIRAEFQSDVISNKEIDEIFGRVGVKPAEQIVGLLARRIDYVTQNIETIEKQLYAAEDKLAAAEVVSDPDVRDEDGLPITEIIEQLDEEGNVISHRLQRPGDSSAQLQEVLEKAGVKDLAPGGAPAKKVLDDETEKPDTSKSTGAVSQPAEASRIAKTDTKLEVSSFQPATTPSRTAQPQQKSPKPSGDDSIPRYQSISLSEMAADDEVEEEESQSRKKSVSFTEDTKPGEETRKSWTARRVEEIMKSAKEQEQLGRQDALIPEGESEEDAFLRGEMLKYGMAEVGAVVAELTLEEGTDNEDEGFDELDDFDEEDDDDEDNYGRYTGSVVDDDYRQRMLELEKKLGVKSRFTEEMEADESDSEAEKEPEGLGRIVIQREDGKPPLSTQRVAPPAVPALKQSTPTTKDKISKGKKSVSFANELDIAPEEVSSAPAPSSAPANERPIPFVEPLSDIVERTGPSKRLDTAKKPKRVSRFKKDQASVPSTDDFDLPKGPLDMPVRFLDQDRPIAPSGPEGKTLAEAVMEHEPTSNAQSLDDANDEFIDQELADEYYRKRREFIHRHGGFLKEDESPVQPLGEADGGRRISKFKAARLSKQ